MSDLTLEFFDGSVEDMLLSGRYVLLDSSKKHEWIKDTVHCIYDTTGPKTIDVDLLVSMISKRTFTKKGEYAISIVADKESKGIFVMVCKCEIKPKQSIRVKLPYVEYVPKWFGILGYRVRQIK